MSTDVLRPGGAWQKVDGKWQAVRDSTVTKPKLLPEREFNIEEMLKKYSERLEKQTKKKKKRKKKKQLEPIEWVDTSFIKCYSDHDQMRDILDKVEADYPEIAERYTIGHSVDERDLLCIRLTKGVRNQRTLLKPMVKFVANIHGDEAVGREMLIGLSRYLSENYKTDPRIQRILDTTDIHLLPSVNPDGNACDKRHNANDEDLNRAFPGWMDMEQPRNELIKDREKEVKAMMNWILDNPFTLSISFHDGRVMINYPWDDSPAAVEGEKAICPDDDVFSELAALYADNHPFMWTGKCLCHCETFSKGISNGAEWYVVDNGMQDYNYLFSNCMEITAELSCWKRPPAHMLQVEWENNLESMLVLLESAHMGIKGKVLDEDGKPLGKALVKVYGREKDMVTTNRGEYWRLLLPGTYMVKATHSNLYGDIESELTEVEVKNEVGTEALEVDLIARIKLEETFLVTSVKVGFCKFFDDKYSEDVKELFKDCNVLDVKLYAPECKPVPDDPNSHQVAFLARISFAPKPMFNFFNERWGEAVVRRPTSEFEQKKLLRRASMYSKEKWCGRNGDWLIKIHETI